MLRFAAGITIHKILSLSRGFSSTAVGARSYIYELGDCNIELKSTILLKILRFVISTSSMNVQSALPVQKGQL